MSPLQHTGDLTPAKRDPITIFGWIIYTQQSYSNATQALMFLLASGPESWGTNSLNLDDQDHVLFLLVNHNSIHFWWTKHWLIPTWETILINKHIPKLKGHRLCMYCTHYKWHIHTYINIHIYISVYICLNICIHIYMDRYGFYAIVRATALFALLMGCDWS